MTEQTIDFTDVRVYKGEVLNFYITCDNAFGFIGYKSGGNVYDPDYQGAPSGAELIVSSGAGTIAASSDLYMKVFEFIDFGKLAAAAGTRKFKMGHALSTTELAIQIQEADSLL